MISLAVKYRPTTFNDVVAQENIKAILEQQIVTKNHKNCYLFTGGAGTGKTTCARIFANELNGGKGKAIEIDAASNNGVENVRNIIDDSKHKSLDGEFKIYILDEVHMLSTGAWNAMLKLLEEPPLKTIFLMCTTDPQKIPATILSRVQRFDFHRIQTNQIVERLDLILQKENYDLEVNAGICYEWDKEALEYIAKIADGGMRDAITLLDKCLSYSGDITVENVVNALGATDYGVMFELLEYIYEKDEFNVIETIENIYMDGKDLKQFTRQFFFFVLDLVKYNICHNFDYVQIPSSYRKECKLETGKKQFIIVLTGELQELLNRIKWEQNPKQFIIAGLLTL